MEYWEYWYVFTSATTSPTTSPNVSPDMSPNVTVLLVNTRRSRGLRIRPSRAGGSLVPRAATPAATPATSPIISPASIPAAGPSMNPKTSPPASPTRDQATSPPAMIRGAPGAHRGSCHHDRSRVPSWFIRAAIFANACCAVRKS